MRGINKLVIEVRPENGYFEKALLFLKPENQGLPQKQISDSAEKLLEDVNSIKPETSRITGNGMFLLLTGIAAGAAVSLLMISVIGLF